MPIAMPPIPAVAMTDATVSLSPIIERIATVTKKMRRYLVMLFMRVSTVSVFLKSLSVTLCFCFLLMILSMIL